MITGMSVGPITTTKQAERYPTTRREQSIKGEQLVISGVVPSMILDDQTVGIAIICDSDHQKERELGKHDSKGKRNNGI